jgi:hypothetical protein
MQCSIFSNCIHLFLTSLGACPCLGRERGTISKRNANHSTVPCLANIHTRKRLSARTISDLSLAAIPCAGQAARQRWAAAALISASARCCLSSAAAAMADFYSEIYAAEAVLKTYVDGAWKTSASGKLVSISNPSIPGATAFRVQGATEALAKPHFELARATAAGPRPASYSALARLPTSCTTIAAPGCSAQHARKTR